MRVNLPFLKIFDRVIAVVFAVMLLFITLGIIIGVVHLFFGLGGLFQLERTQASYLRMISDVLTLFILIELSRSLAGYFSTNRLRMTFIVDAGIVFVLREVMIKLFENSIEVAEIYALAALLFVLGALRIGSVLVFQREKLMLDTVGQQER